MGALTPALPGFENGPVELAHPTAKATVYAKDQLLPENTPDAPTANGVQGKQRPHGSRSPSQKPLHDIVLPPPVADATILASPEIPGFSPQRGQMMAGYEPYQRADQFKGLPNPLIPAHVSQPA